MPENAYSAIEETSKALELDTETNLAPIDLTPATLLPGFQANAELPISSPSLVPSEGLTPCSRFIATQAKRQMMQKA